ncbi:uncharacterized protein LOC119067158 [Bradysia coprophila]|uniref:uncharacterized protein LOC119067158 n=1 Tax=Bradysia coprophila TaxID=38358 RepID=UPI00187D9E79|nr:uncharacterized protein LOC119067158 [Bradysia coprophila]XP_037025847.1 uncharacterized protein LOC119067158 [Bradysia coprophila]
MKYPQLVSARAVNAISDWLVTRLEQLGIDAPLVYSRLLLSLLHTPLQINALDLAEISDINIGNIGRKSNRRFSSSDTEAIKRIAAIESLIEAVAADQKISNVEKLVDDLCEKLREIEGQQNSVDESQLTDSTEIETMKRSSSPEDPAKRYYRAFPALSKDLSNDKAITATPKPLTWPLNCGSSVKSGNYSIGSSSTAGVKRKPKRRRNQAMSKGKTSFNRRCSNGVTWDTDFEGSWEMGRDLIREFVMMQNNRNRSISESDASAFVGIKDIIDKKNAGNNASDARQFVEKKAHKTDADGTVDYKVISVDNDDFDVMSKNAFETENSLENITYTSLSEIEGSLSTAPRRLYEREISNESLNMSIQEANNLASFEAKFDRSVEAIWDNCDDDDKFVPPKPNNVESLKSFWFNYYKHHYNTDHQHESQSLLSLASDDNDLGHHQTVDYESTNKLLPQFLNNCNDLRFCGVSIAVNSSQPLQSAIKPDSIWSNKAECEDDGSFYANAMWNSAAAAAENLMQPSQMASVDSQLNDFGAVKAKESGCYNNYDLPSLSKWSDCTFEIPFVPPSSSTSSTTNLSIHQDLSANTEDKIRRDLLENSYFYDLKSLPVMNNFKRTDDQFNATRLGPQLNTHFYQPFFPMDKETDVYPPNDLATRMARPSSNVTLTNHSKDSKFVEVKASTAVGYNSNNRVNYAEQMKVHDGRVKYPQQIATPKVEEENLLTSERTHFRPIIKYQDGFSFDIPDTLDEVKFNRTECGAMYLNSEKYMEYNARGVEDDEFLVKFCIKQNDKCCQTDVTSLDRFSFLDRGYICDQSTSVSTDLNDREDDFNSSFGLSEEIDAYNKTDVNLDLENWTMGNNGRKCSRNENAHSLWEHCSGCSCDIASKPANQMMIEELCADGDQIMSDLRCMYIGSDWNDEEEEEEGEEQDELEEEEDNDGGSVRGVHKEDNEEVVTVEPNNLLFNVSKLISDLLKPETAQSLVHAIGTNIFEEIALSDTRKDSQLANKTDDVNEKETKNEIKLRGLCISERSDDSESNNNFSNNFVGGLWANNDNNIWQKDLRPSTDNCVWSNYGVHNSNTAVRDSSNWEHSNLERIWNSDDDLSPETIEIYDKSKSNNADATEPIEDDYVFDLIETHELAIDNEALKRYIDFNRTFNGNTGNDTGNDDGFMSLHSNLNRCDRKRRHSASQSISEALEAMIGEGADRKLASMFDDELNVTTIITCNYWTTDTSSYVSGKNAALEINPTSSILKHIPMVSRPLTR